MNHKAGSKTVALLSALVISLAGVGLFVLFFNNGACYAYKRGAVSAVISPAYSFFADISNRDYAKAWANLTAASQKNIVESIKSAYKSDKINIGSLEIYKNMKSGGDIAAAYWKGYLKSFNPKMLLKYSIWSIKFIHSKIAEIKIKYIYSKHTALLKVFKENKKWKFGLAESLWTRAVLNKDIAAINKFL
ncbi:MAG: hypothetical protein ACYDDB_03970 [bacterium]